MARIVFQPIEEILRVYFSKTLATTIPDATKKSAASGDKGNNLNRTSLQQASDALISLLAVQSSLILILITFVPAYLPLVLMLLLPPKYLSTSAPSVLQAWVWYIPVLAVNGGLEAFVSSVAMSKDLNRQSR